MGKNVYEKINKKNDMDHNVLFTPPFPPPPPPIIKIKQSEGKIQLG